MKFKSKVLGLMFVASIMFVSTTSITSAQGMQMDVVDTAMSDSRFSMLVELIKAADLVDTLKGAGPFTVFAPTNDAFAKVPAAKLQMLKNDREMLRTVLLYHVLNMKVPASAAKTMAAPTAAGMSVKDARVRVKMKSGMAPTVMVDKSRVVQADIMASNGVIHAVDTVLMPKMNKKAMGSKGMDSKTTMK